MKLFETNKKETPYKIKNDFMPNGWPSLNQVKYSMLLLQRNESIAIKVCFWRLENLINEDLQLKFQGRGHTSKKRREVFISCEILSIRLHLMLFF